MIILISQIVVAASCWRQGLLFRRSDENVFLTKLILVRALFNLFTGAIGVFPLLVLVESREPSVIVHIELCPFLNLFASVGLVRMVCLSHLHYLFLYFHRISGLLVLSLLLLELLDLLLLRLPLDLTLLVWGFLLLELALGETLVVLSEGPVANVACACLVQARVVVFGVCLVQVAVEELLCALWVSCVRVELRGGSILELLIEVAQVFHHLVAVVVDVNVALVFRVLDEAKTRFVQRLLGCTIL